MKLPSSFRDPAGFVYHGNGIIYRQVNSEYREHYDLLMGSGLYQDLVDREALIPHEEAPLSETASPEAYKILRPRVVPFISYPYEWCFSQLKDAALLTLEVQERAMAFGMCLKDASAYNIQFCKGKPVHIDTLSFEKYVEGKPWIAYRQFCQHFLGPLALMARTDARLGSLSRIHLDGIPLDLAVRLLPASTFLNPGLLIHLHLHAKTQKTFSRTASVPDASPLPGTASPRGESGGAGRMRMGKPALAGLIRSVRKAVERLESRRGGTEWGDYYSDNSYGEASLAAKKEIIAAMLGGLKPAKVWDLGANSGLFSRISSGMGIETMSFDLDHDAVEASYLRARENRETHLLPLILDLVNPSPPLGWANRERQSLSERGPADACMALALIHHLAISNHLPFGMISEWLRGMARFLIIEFVPKSDSQVKRLLASRPDVFPGYREEEFASAFSEHFRILECRPVAGSERKIFLMEGR